MTFAERAHVALRHNCPVAVDARQVDHDELLALAVLASTQGVLLIVRHAMALADDEFTSLCALGGASVRMECVRTD